MDGTLLQPGTKIPAEFLGLARQFVREAKVFGDKFVDVANDLSKKSRPGFRQRKLADILKIWERSLTDKFVLKHCFSLGKGCLEIYDLQLIGMRAHDKRWNNEEWETGVILLIRQFDIEVNKRWGLDAGDVTVASVCLHGLARWFERTRLTDHNELLADLAVLVDARFPEGTRKEIPCQNGKWLGTMEWSKNHDKKELAFDVRTFVDHGGVVDG